MRNSRWAPPPVDGFDSLMDSRSVWAAFQPIVELRTGEVVAYEGLARPPAPSGFPDTESMLEEAYRRGRVGEFDWVCRAAVFRAVLQHKIPQELPIFVNVEPAALGAPCPADIIGLFAAATRRCRFVVEVTERSLANDPAELLAAVARTRDVSIGVALDDVGAHPASLALMPLVAPDIIKLDLSLVQAQPNPEIALIVATVRSEAERTGAVILAEGVESTEHIAIAESMGATLGQGWLFGSPGPLPDDPAVPRRPLAPFSAPTEIAETPFTEASWHRTPSPSNKPLLDAISLHLEREVLQSPGKVMLLSSFQSAKHFGLRMQRRYEQLAQHTILTAVLGERMPADPGAGIRGVTLHPDDPLCREWCVIVLGSQIAAALVAREAGPGQFDAVVTHDRGLVVAAARSLCQRLPPIDLDPAPPA